MVDIKAVKAEMFAAVSGQAVDTSAVAKTTLVDTVLTQIFNEKARDGSKPSKSYFLNLLATAIQTETHDPRELSSVELAAIIGKYTP